MEVLSQKAGISVTEISASAMVPSQQRQLMLVVEGTSALGQSWNLLRTEYLDKIIRSFCGFDGIGQKNPNSQAEMALVVFYSHGSHNSCLLHQTSWTTNLDLFSKWLSSINFSGGGFGEAAIAEGLAEALLMCCPTPATTPISQVIERQKHCILVAASNPHRLPTAVPRPPVQNLIQPSANSDPSAMEHWWLADADTVAKAFSQCSVSLSVISPRELHSLKSIFNGAKRNTRVADQPLDVPKYSHMILISENFMEARLSLTHTAGSLFAVSPLSLPKTEPSLITPLPSAAPAPVSIMARSAASGMIAGRSGTANGIMPAVTVKMEASSIPAVSAASGMSPLLQNPVSVSLSMPHSSSSQESILVPDSTTAQDFKPMVNGPTPSHRPGLVSGNASLSMNPSQSRPILSTTAGATTPPGLSMTTMLSSNSGSSAVTSLPSLGIAQSALGLPNSQVSIGAGMGMTQSVGAVGFNNANNVGVHTNAAATAVASTGSTGANMQVVGMGTGQGAIAATNIQNVTGGHVVNHSVLPNLGQMGANSVNAQAIMPTPQMPTVSNNALQVPGAVTTPPQQPPNAAPKYAKIWDGMLIGQRQGKPVFICKLEAYRQNTSPETYDLKLFFSELY